MLLVKSVTTVLSIKVSQVQLQVVAHCLLVNKLLVQAGALLTLRKRNNKSSIYHLLKSHLRVAF
jgi:hypothetical protein